MIVLQARGRNSSDCITTSSRCLHRLFIFSVIDSAQTNTSFWCSRICPDDKFIIIKFNQCTKFEIGVSFVLELEERGTVLILGVLVVKIQLYSCIR